MATIEEARQEVAQAKAQLAQQEAQIQAARLPEPQKQELLRRTMAGRVQLQERERLLNLEKARATKEIGEYRTGVIQPYEAQIQQVAIQREQQAVAQRARQQEISEWAIAEKYARRGKYPLGESKSVIRKFEDMGGAARFAAVGEQKRLQAQFEAQKKEIAQQVVEGKILPSQIRFTPKGIVITEPPSPPMPTLIPEIKAPDKRPLWLRLPSMIAGAIRPKVPRQVIEPVTALAEASPLGLLAGGGFATGEPITKEEAQRQLAEIRKKTKLGEIYEILAPERALERVKRARESVEEVTRLEGERRVVISEAVEKLGKAETFEQQEQIKKEEFAKLTAAGVMIITETGPKGETTGWKFETPEQVITTMRKELIEERPVEAKIGFLGAEAAAWGLAGIGVGAVAPKIITPIVKPITAYGMKVAPIPTALISKALPSIAYGVIGGLTGARMAKGYLAEGWYGAVRPAVTTAAFLGGAYIGGKIYATGEMRGAIDRAIQQQTTPKQISKEIQIKRLKIPAEGKKELKELLNQGYILRQTETKLVARTTADAKILPSIKGRFVEVLTRDGRVVYRYSVGGVVSMSGGQRISKNVLMDAVGKIEEGKMRTFATWKITRPGKTWPIEKYIETFDEVVLTKQQKILMQNYLRATGETRLIKTLKKPMLKDIYRLQTLGKLTPDQVNILLRDFEKAGLYGRAELEYLGKGVKYDIRTEKFFVPGEGVRITKLGVVQEKGIGAGVFWRPGFKPDVSRAIKGWDVVTPVAKFPKAPKPKPFVSKGLVTLPEPLRMKAYVEAFVKVPSPTYAIPTIEVGKMVAPTLAKTTLTPFIGTLSQLKLTPITKLKQIQRLEPISVTKLKVKEIEIFKTPTKVKLGLGVIPITKVTPAQKITQLQKLAQIQKLALKIPTRLKITTAITQVPRIPYQPLIIPKPVLPTTFVLGPRRLPKRVKRRRPLFIGEIRRRGKWIPVTKPTKFVKAFGLARRRVVTTLGAALRVRKVGVGIVPIRPTRFFRPAKREPGVIVQVRGRRLASPLEVREIKRARRKSIW